MKFGVRLPMFGKLASRDTFKEIAETAEGLEFDCIWGGDHIALPTDSSDTYPFSENGEPPEVLTSSSDAFEVFPALAFVAGITEEITVGTNTCIPPLRHPVHLVKMVHSIEALSGGRFDFGIAPGWMQSEFEVLDVPFDERGPRTDEFLRIFNAARTGGTISYDGEFHSFSETSFFPKPANGRPDIWVGGGSRPAFRRLAEFGDGWTTLWKKPDEIMASKEVIHEFWDEYDRSGDPKIAVMRPIDLDQSTPRAAERPLVGSHDDVIHDVQSYRAAGCTRLIVNFYSRDFDKQMTQLRKFGSEVLPSF